MKKNVLNILMSKWFLLVVIMIVPARIGQCMEGEKAQSRIKLTQPQYRSNVSVENSLLQRKSVRSYLDEPLTLDDISQLLWAAQGITHSRGFRTAPSAGALYPLELYIVVGNVAEVAAGIYKYKPEHHELLKIVGGDKRTELCHAALNQRAIKRAPAVIVFCAVYSRTTSKYGQRGIRYVLIEAGHSAQNVCLQSVSLGLGTVPIGAFNDDRVKKIVHCETDEDPLYIMPVGKLK